MQRAVATEQKMWNLNVREENAMFNLAAIQSVVPLRECKLSALAATVQWLYQRRLALSVNITLLMVSVAVSKLGCSNMFFVEPGFKVNGAYYRDVLLKQQMLPDIRHMSGDFFIFHQDSAPAHRASSCYTT